MQIPGVDVDTRAEYDTILNAFGGAEEYAAALDAWHDLKVREVARQVAATDVEADVDALLPSTVARRLAFEEARAETARVLLEAAGR